VTPIATRTNTPGPPITVGGSPLPSQSRPLLERNSPGHPGLGGSDGRAVTDRARSGSRSAPAGRTLRNGGTGNDGPVSTAAQTPYTGRTTLTHSPACTYGPCPPRMTAATAAGLAGCRSTRSASVFLTYPPLRVTEGRKTPATQNNIQPGKTKIKIKVKIKVKVKTMGGTLNPMPWALGV
jgi:hypothetical protein